MFSDYREVEQWSRSFQLRLITVYFSLWLSRRIDDNSFKRDYYANYFSSYIQTIITFLFYVSIFVNYRILFFFKRTFDFEKRSKQTYLKNNIFLFVKLFYMMHKQKTFWILALSDYDAEVCATRLRKNCEIPR